MNGIEWGDISMAGVEGDFWVGCMKEIPYCMFVDGYHGMRL